ncbi:MAG: histidinol-phosphate transaminase [Acidimicrobiales bacterium]
MSRPPVRDDLAALTGYHSPQVDVEVRLNTNEAPEPPPAEFSAAVAEAVKTLEWHRYPDRAATELRRAIGEIYDLGFEQVFCANGSNEVLQTLLLTFAGPGRKTLTFEPTYALHSHLSRITGSEPVAIDRDGNFSLDPSRAAAAVRAERPAVTFLCSPNNPTGLVEPNEVIDEVLAAVSEVNGLLVVDEAYGEFAPRSAVELLNEDVPLVVTKTYSKTWAMAGARLGYLLGPEWLIEKLEMVVLPYHLDSVKQAAGLAALQFVDSMNARVASIVEERGRVQTALAEMGAEVWPSGSNFVLFRPPMPGDEIWQALVDRSVLVRNTASWDHLDGCLRVTIGTGPDNSRFLAALADILGAPNPTGETPTSSGEKESDA